MKYSVNEFDIINSVSLGGISTQIIVGTYTDNHDTNYNIWNVDLSCNWEFAPESQNIPSTKIHVEGIFL